MLLQYISKMKKYILLNLVHEASSGLDPNHSRAMNNHTHKIIIYNKRAFFAKHAQLLKYVRKTS